MQLEQLFTRIEEQSKKAMLSLWASADHPMRSSFENLLEQEKIMGEPVLESAFPWKQYGSDDWMNLFDPQTLQTLRRVRSFSPFSHQVESWKTLMNGESLVVTSGTGSGKTECFLYPILNDIASNNNSGVQAIFLYPLNALMEDQKERLGKYCDALGVNFAVYNGNTPEHEQDIEVQSPFTSELQCRDDIRNEIPQILLTNPSMLEYILVRPKDQDFINASSGQLKWIVIDEAHSYSGSAAVELQYQIKRILDAFGINDISQINFVCTSATISGDNGADRLRHFISKLTGQLESRIHVIGGERVVPRLNAESLTRVLETHQSLQMRNIMNNIITLRSELNKKGALPLKKVWMILNNQKTKNYDEKRVLNIIDVLCDTRIDNEPVLNVRLHLFYRGINGIYTCISPQCTSTHITDMGSLTFYQTSQCLSCGSPMLELMQCKSCGTIYIKGEVNNQTQEIRQKPSSGSDDNLWGLGIYDENSNSNTASNSDDWTEFELCKLSADTSIQPKNGVTLMMFHFENNGNKVFLRNGRGASDENTWVECRHQNDILCASCGNTSSRFKHFRINTAMINTIIGPILLNETKSGANDWGKFIAFTDSRQQTAMSAKSFNIDEERAYMRSKLFKELSLRKEQFTSSQQYRSNEMIISLLANKPDRSDNEERMYQDALAYNRNSNQPISLREVADIIYCREMLAHMDEDYLTDPNIDYEKPYKVAMLRNLIGRRTINDPNIENMGLITIKYPGLNSIACPDILKRIIPSATDKDWQDFLKICIDYELRAHNHFQPLIRREKLFVRDTNISRPIFISGYQVPQGATYKVATWPTVATNNNGVSDIQHHLVVLLCAACGYHTLQDLQNHQQEIDSILHQSWNDLVNNVLTPVQNGSGYDDPEYYKDHRYRGAYYIDLSADSTKANVALTEGSYLCPVSHRFVDTIFMGYSPVIKGFISEHNISRYRVDTQRVFRSPEIKSNEMGDIARWISSNTEVLNYIEAGVWNDTYDRLFDGLNKTVYISAEHSAQQDRRLLGKYKDEFVSNNLNVLFCSTTMEMGVDIGDIEVAVMETVPPTSANYLQRAGRAGRSGQSKAIALTICNSSSIGVRVFNDTMWPFVSTNEMNDVVESAKILQRHFNSYFFRNYICSQNGLKIRTDLETFFELVPRVCSDFITDLQQQQVSNSSKQAFENCFVGQSFAQAITKTIAKISSIESDYLNIINVMVADYTNYANLTNDPSAQRRAKAIRWQLASFRHQNLLSYLSECQFFPDSNMPTAIIEFVHFNTINYARYIRLIDDYMRYIDAYINAKAQNDRIAMDDAWDNAQKTKKKINRLKKKVTSTREMKIALNEYAPEQTVVVNEENYVSGGVSLENEFGSMTQKRYLRKCDNCQTIYYDPITSVRNNCSCNNQSHLRSVLQAYQQTSPFTVAFETVGMESDINANRQETTDKTYYNIGSLLTNLDWSNATNVVNMVEIATNDGDGEIIYDNAGKGFGFAICKKCGRTYVEERNDEVIPRFVSLNNNGHKTLHGNDCIINSANDLERHVVLTGRHQTDYCAFKFYENSNSNNPVNDQILIYSLGVVLRKALAQELGIDEDEIDYGITFNNNIQTLFLFDTNKGGCGYSKAFNDPNKCQKIFARALNILQDAPCDCETNEKGACCHCLIDHNSLHFVNKLSKARAMSWLAAQQQKTVNVPQSILTYSPNSHVAFKNALSVLTNSITNPNITGVNLFVTDNGIFAPNEWTSRNSKMGQIVERLILNGKGVNLYIEYHSNLHNSFEDIYFYSKLEGQFSNINLIPIQDMGQYKTVLELDSSNGRFRYFTDEQSALSFSNRWGLCNNLYVDEMTPTYANEALPTLQDLIKLSSTQGDIIRDGIIGTPNFPLASIYDVICKETRLQQADLTKINSILNGANVSIEYSDNYLISGLGCQILFALIDAMKGKYGFNITDITLYLDSDECYNNRYNDYSYINFGFDTPDSRNEYIKDSFESLFNITPSFNNFKSEHFRWLRFKTASGKYIEIRPDGGIGRGWLTNRIRYIDINYMNTVYDSNMTIITNNSDILFYVKIPE